MYMVSFRIFILGGSSGDSGGPIWITGEEGTVLVGVYSRGIDSKYAFEPISTGAGVAVEINEKVSDWITRWNCLLYTSPSPRDVEESRMPSSA